MHKLNAMQQRVAVQVRWCGNLHLVAELQTDRYLRHEFESSIVYMHHPTLFPKRTRVAKYSFIKKGKPCLKKAKPGKKKQIVK